jgi:hypothetical protein
VLIAYLQFYASFVEVACFYEDSCFWKEAGRFEAHLARC